MKLLKQLLEMARKLDQEMPIERAIALLAKRRHALIVKRDGVINSGAMFTRFMPVDIRKNGEDMYTYDDIIDTRSIADATEARDMIKLYYDTHQGNAAHHKALTFDFYDNHKDYLVYPTGEVDDYTSLPFIKVAHKPTMDERGVDETDFLWWVERKTFSANIDLEIAALARRMTHLRKKLQK